ncbi:MAG: NAD(P)/FAD-dependent oxidoreductase [Gemmatimonadetes bacterium]|nr:NAD(P)/FAD-dependent oxidoreductase [Gemmatimonadota bacterium]
MHDAVVVGARCAGSPTAMLLARRGYRVLLVDRATFPSDTMSTHYIHISGTARLARWGLLDRLAATGCPPITRLSMDIGLVVFAGSPPPLAGVDRGFAPRRTVLDKMLLDAAAEAGAEVRQGFVVEELIRDGERITGIRARARGGAAVTERARIVIGADGRRSFVARTVGAAEYEIVPPLTTYYYTYWSGVPLDRTELYARPGRAFFAIPTHDGLACVMTAWTAPEFKTFRADIEGNYLRTLDSAPSLAERVRSGRREERFFGSADLPNFFRKPYGPGWALVGDAGFQKDPLTAQGISDAFRDAELLAEAVDAGLGGRRPMEDALADYERRRNEAAMPLYTLTCEQARLAAKSPKDVELFAAISRNQTAADRFFGVDAGTVPVHDFFSPANLARILGAAAP